MTCKIILTGHAAVKLVHFLTSYKLLISTREDLMHSQLKVDTKKNCDDVYDFDVFSLSEVFAYGRGNNC